MSIPETSKFRAVSDEIVLVEGILLSIPETSKFRAIGDEILLVEGILLSIPETSKFRAIGDEILLVEGIPLGNRAGRATSSRTTLSSRRFFIKNHLSPVPSLLLSAKSHARCGCSFVNALTTPSLRYQLFAVCACCTATAQISILSMVNMKKRQATVCRFFSEICPDGQVKSLRGEIWLTPCEICSAACGKFHFTFCISKIFHYSHRE